MKYKFSSLIGVVALLVSANAFALQTAAVSITQMSSDTNGNYFVETTGTFQNPAGCQNGRYAINTADPNKKDFLAILLTAKAAAIQVKLNIANGTCTVPDLSGGASASFLYPRITAVELQ